MGVMVGVMDTGTGVEGELPPPVSPSVPPCSLQLRSVQQPRLPLKITHIRPVSHESPSEQHWPPLGEQL